MLQQRNPRQSVQGCRAAAGRSLACFRPVHCSSHKVSSAQPSGASNSVQHQLWMSLGASVAVALLLTQSAPAQALGLESVDLLPGLESIKTPSDYRSTAKAEAAKLQAADENFKSSDTLKRLLENSEANKAKNKKAIADKYCYRQAEMGVGDCGGLRFIPGLTESGKQRTPDWLSDLLGVERAPEESEETLTMKKLFGGEVPK